MVPKKIEKLRIEVEQAKQGSHGRRVRYPDSIKRRVLKLLRAGHSVPELSSQTGVGVSTLFKWSQNSGEEFRKVTAVAEPTALESNEHCQIMLANGVRIEGVSIGLLKKIISEWLP